MLWMWASTGWKTDILCGDVDFDDVLTACAYHTGAEGRRTDDDLLLLKNTMQAYRVTSGMIILVYGLNDIVEMKKEHPCHKSRYWKVIRMGADIKIKCQGCGAVVMFPRHEFERKMKKVWRTHVLQRKEE